MPMPLSLMLTDTTPSVTVEEIVSFPPSKFERIGDEIVPHDAQEAFVACDKKGINVDMFFFPYLFKADNAGTERFAQVERTFCTGIFWCSRRLRCKIFVTSTVSLRAALRSSSLMPSLCSIVA